ncbi:MAG: YbhB/YbcL family Raf kinase inhibitor-like protein [Verrucomicrobia bacterium]|nr:YbhB/YbcL family Raf kinase inhibitor-like protein [Verrucomicrobiota bacterium]
MRITSPKFKHGEPIPSIYTCEGYDWNPPVDFHEVPKEAKSLVLMMTDPDVPTNIRPDGLWVHWIVYEIPPSSKGIAEHSRPPGTHGRGTNMRTAYMGPCPPDREHRYFFTLYALDFMPEWEKGLNKEDVEKKIEGHIIAKAELMGTYKLQRK